MLEHLRRLQAKWHKRQAERKRQKALYAKTGDAGHAKAAGAAGRAMRKLAGLIDTAKEALYSVAAGFPYWGGAAIIVRTEVRPLVLAHGIPITSTKRWETFGNPSSDHYRGNRLAYAEDYGTASNFSLAQEVRTALDGGVHVDYQSFNIVRRGHTYRVQIIAGTHGTGPHLHVGIERVA